MKKHLFTCFLASLCLYGSTTTAQVADSPGADFLHRSVPQVSPEQGDTHRSGETRIDTLPELNGLVDHSAAEGQEGESSSAQEGGLIYGEIINPDSLGPIILKISPYGPKSSLAESEIELPTTHGKFFDGVLDPRVRKFSTSIPMYSGLVYLTLMVGDRPVLENFMLLQGDSVKIGLDLQRFQVVFGGPSGQWFESQYASVRELKQTQFDAPRVLLQGDREALLDRADNRAQLMNADEIFGARIRIVEMGEEVIDRELDLLSWDQLYKRPGMATLKSAKKLLDGDRYDLLQAEVIGNYYALRLSSLRRLGLAMAENKGDDEVRYEAIGNMLSSLKNQMADLASPHVSAGYLDMAAEWIHTKALLENSTFRKLVVQEFVGESKDRLLYEYSANRLNRQDNPQKFLSEVGVDVETHQWRRYFKDLADRFELHVPLKPVTFVDSGGKKFTFDDLKGEPTLLYFYFSSCAASEGYFHQNVWPLYQELAKEIGFKVVAVSVDNNQQLWKDAIGTYSDESLINSNLPSKKWKSWLDYYLINAYPRTILLDGNADILSLGLGGGEYADFKGRFLENITRKRSNSHPSSSDTIRLLP